MKKIMFLIFLITNSVFSQNTYIAKYDMKGKHLNNENYNALLIFNSSKFLYTYKTEKNNNSYIDSENEININYNDKKTYFLYGDNVKDSLFDKKKKKENVFFVKEIIPKIKWTFHKDKKTINKIVCLKATTHFRGRNYTAWYAPSIPVPFGPWKLQGLPGLIMNAHDDSKMITFNMLKLTRSKNKYKLEINSVSKKINLIDYIKDEKIRIKNIIKLFAAKSKDRGTKPDIISFNSMEKNYFDLEPNLKIFE